MANKRNKYDNGLLALSSFFPDQKKGYIVIGVWGFRFWIRGQPGTPAMQAQFHLFRHTADMGIRVHADTLSELLQPAVEGLYSIIGDLRASPASKEESPFSFSGEDSSILLRNCLAELLFRFESRKEMAVAILVTEFSENLLSGIFQLHSLDELRSSYDTEVKAITYHQLAIEEKKNSDNDSFFEATIIVDI